MLRFFILLSCLTLSAHAGEIYLVLGSDTAIWQGMNTSEYYCDYVPDLYTVAGENAYQVMDSAYRNRLLDSYGTPLKLTWWMMAGNIFRYAIDTNIPLPNIMTLYLMKTYHGEQIQLFGDELSLHYHTFQWFDYDNDGRAYWNQSQTFMDCFDDFNVTLAQFLLEEEIFPVSFRSGWHYMDNDWQNYLDDRILPFSMHNDYPARRNDTVEPLDNIYDWSEAPSEFVPYHPNKENYQIPGQLKGWNVRSAHLTRVLSRDLLDTLFVQASNGQDQVACFWGHLPETDFLENIEKIHQRAKLLDEHYPDVKFRYCTAIEAMQRWLQTRDQTPPQLTLTEQSTPDGMQFIVESDEPIFQQQPFVAVKDIYERYQVLDCEPIGPLSWVTRTSVPGDLLARAGAAVCDSVGNLAMTFIDALPKDIYIDNQDPGYREIVGTWSASDRTAWGTDSRTADLTVGDSAVVQWAFETGQSSLYQVFLQQPDVPNRTENVHVKVFYNGILEDHIVFNGSLPAQQWIYLATLEGGKGGQAVVQLSASAHGSDPQVLGADVIKVSALVRSIDLYLHKSFIDLGKVIIEENMPFELVIGNSGVEKLQIESIESASGFTSVINDLPFQIGPMSQMSLALEFTPPILGAVEDTLIIKSNDPVEPEKRVLVKAQGMNYFFIVDNQDTDYYQESGEWHTSVAQAHGPSSRYAFLYRSPKPWAEFSAVLQKSGLYEISIIIPKTVNAAENALYEICLDGVPIDSVHVDQNQNSGDWVPIIQVSLPQGKPVQTRVIDDGSNQNGAVLRADAVQYALIEERVVSVKKQNDSMLLEFDLGQNYPNPFNSTTTIPFSIPADSRVLIEITNILGARVYAKETFMAAGNHSFTWNGTDLFGKTVASGIYTYRIRTNEASRMKKMLYLR
jgi:hypothetical protein